MTLLYLNWINYEKSVKFNGKGLHRSNMIHKIILVKHGFEVKLNMFLIVKTEDLIFPLLY